MKIIRRDMGEGPTSHGAGSQIFAEYTGMIAMDQRCSKMMLKTMAPRVRMNWN